jgi:hypothetical protein
MLGPGSCHGGTFAGQKLDFNAEELCPSFQVLLLSFPSVLPIQVLFRQKSVQATLLPSSDWPSSQDSEPRFAPVPCAAPLVTHSTSDFQSKAIFNNQLFLGIHLLCPEGKLLFCESKMV